MEHLFPFKHSYLIPLLPLLGAPVAGFFGARFLKRQSHWPIWITVGASAALSLWLLVGMLGLSGGENHGTLSGTSHWFTWISVGSFRADAAAFLDPLSAVMLCVVTGIGFLITIFAKGYMEGDSGYFRFFAYLGLFIFAMTCLVMGNNFLMLYLGWEGVGLCSYLLIGHYYHKPSAREAAKKAFIVNRVGDFGFALGIMLIFYIFGTISYFGADHNTFDGVIELATAGGPSLIPGMTPERFALISVVPFLLMLGAFGKSAQFPLYVWLPDAMEGPTPVSALIHAATMVTAGVYMIARCATLFVGTPAALYTVAAVGAFTALFAATIALRQFDLKKVFAYSTVSQLGFMFVGVAALAPVAGIFHLVTHAFFKALLFLGSGVVMHAMLGELDMRKMSGLRKVLPWTNALLLVGCLALAGVPPFAGFFSKDEILHYAFAMNPVLGAVLLLTAFLTAYYTFRLYFRVFWGPEVIPPPSEEHAAAHAPDHDTHTAPGHSAHDAGHGHSREPAIMIAPLVLLALGAVLAGFLNWPPRHSDLGAFLGQSPSLRDGFLVASARGQFGAVDPAGFGQASGEHPFPLNAIMGISALVAIAGILLAWYLHYKDRQAAQRLADSMQPMTGVVEHKYWVDEIYQAGIIEPLRRLGTVCFAIDRFIIDGIIWVLSFVPQAAGATLKLTTQRGSLQGYAMAMIFGILIVLAVVFL